MVMRLTGQQRPVIPSVVEEPGCAAARSSRLPPPRSLDDARDDGRGEQFASGLCRRFTAMKMLSIAMLVLALAACKVEKTGKDTYKVVAPTPAAKKAAKDAGDKLKAETEKLKEKVKTETTSTHK